MSRKEGDTKDSGRGGSEQPGLTELFKMMMAEIRRRDDEVRRRDEQERIRREEDNRRREEDHASKSKGG